MVCIILYALVGSSFIGLVALSYYALTIERRWKTQYLDSPQYWQDIEQLEKQIASMGEIDATRLSTTL